MSNITVTIVTPASGPFNLQKLFAGNNYGGAVTITPATIPAVKNNVQYCSVQSDPANGANFAIVGDKNITAAGAPAGKRLAAGALAIDQGSSTIPLSQRYINGSVATVVINVEAF